MNKTISKSISILLTIILMIFISCSKTSDEVLPSEPVPIDLSSTQIALIESENDFAFDLFNKVATSSQGGENIIISPLSVSIALSMTLNGADGATGEAMKDALKVNGIDPSVINQSYSDLTEALLNVDKRVLISIANSVWIENDFQVKKSFTDILTGYYNAEARSFDIGDATAPSMINNWIESKTNGLIKNMIDRLNDNTVMLLINAIYFKGKWKSQFDKTRTINMPFYAEDGTVKDVPMMRQKAEFEVMDGDGFVVAEFPYGQGNYVMDIILPDEREGLPGLVTSLTGTSFDSWTGQFNKREVELSFPRFKYGYKKQLKEVLSDMGMGIAFTGLADFSGISDSYDLLINDVTHQAFIETNEEGTEAAAATIVDIGVTSLPPAPMVLTLDHPFVYLIRETSTNSIIFMGKVADPSAN